MDIFKGTTILAVLKDSELALGGDGQVTFNNTVLKANARKVRRIYDGKILVGFAGATADAFTLFERFETKIKEFSGDMTRAAVELAKDWRTDRVLRRLEAMLLAGDRSKLLLLSGTGDVVEPEQGVIGIGSGGNYAYAAALAYLDAEKSGILKMSAKEVVQRSLRIAAQICIYTNSEIIVEELR